MTCALPIPNHPTVKRRLGPRAQVSLHSGALDKAQTYWYGPRQWFETFHIRLINALQQSGA